MAKEKVYGIKPKVKNVEKVSTEEFDKIFTLVTQKGITRIAVGNSIVSQMQFDTVKAAKEYVSSKPWELIVNVTLLILEKTNKMKEEEKSK